MKTPTLWVTTTQLPTYPTISKDTTSDVVIIGAGLTGILSAYQLAKAGKSVVILEKNSIADGATHLTTAFLTEIIDTDLAKLIDTFGIEISKNIIEAHAKAIELIETIVKEEKIDCNFKRCSNYVYAHSDAAFGNLLGEYDAMATLGIEAHLSADPLAGFKNFGYIEVYNQAKFHPIKFIRGVLNVLNKHKVEIYEKSEVDEIEESSMEAIAKNGKRVSGKWILATTYEPFGQPIGLFFKKGMYTTYVLEAHVRHQMIREGIYEDTKNPYNYFRIDPAADFDTLIIGGQDHRSEIPIDPEKNFEALEEYLQEILEDREYSIVNRWDGPILESSDGLAFIGPHKNLHIMHAFGFSGNGMTYAGISASIFHDLILGKKNKFFEIYRTSRVLGPKAMISKAVDYGGKFIHGATKNVFRRKKKGKSDNKKA